jgi:hypothetical protein
MEQDRRVRVPERDVEWEWVKVRVAAVWVGLGLAPEEVVFVQNAVGKCPTNGARPVPSSNVRAVAPQ